MEEDIAIIDKNTRNEKIRNFFINNKKQIIISISAIILIIFGYFAYGDFKNKKRIKIAERYNSVTINFISGSKTSVKSELIEIMEEKDTTYSPLALYFIIDNDIETTNEEINKYFDSLINEVKLDEEIKNLIIFKKGLFNSDFETENNLISILSPLINSKSVWKSHALYLMAEYFYSKDQKHKAREFYNQIISLENSNENIKLETKKRLRRDFSE
jgi:predicted negative regulator of RcsB-dependent stress response|tara:strand:- start:231 stop:875 length:645 start_codon:yes stop_codon:yes gene_type:complete